MLRLSMIVLAALLAGASCPDHSGKPPSAAELRCAPSGRACSGGADCCSGVCNNQQNASIGTCR